MKIISILLLWLFMFCGAFGMSESLDSLLKELHFKHPFTQEKILKKWPGLESEVALNEILDELLKPGENRNYAEQSHILDSMKFPRKKIVGLILEKIEKRQSPEDGLGRAFGLVEYYTDDERVFSYLVGFLNDTRLAGRREPMAAADYDTVTPRICDIAAEIIREGLEKQKLLKPGDPEWGESGGATSYQKADSSLTFLKQFLVKNQLMTEEKPSARPTNESKASDSLSKDTPRPNTQARELKRPDLLLDSPRQVVPWLWIGGCVFTLFGFVVWRVMKLRS